ncbi:MAG: 6-bladed beta-propeller [Chitinophagaceae bacterium]|nr:MAG: 6-bladed beta-propeller [Chitinophagaceae bacterium]
MLVNLYVWRSLPMNRQASSLKNREGFKFNLIRLKMKNNKVNQYLMHKALFIFRIKKRLGNLAIASLLIGILFPGCQDRQRVSSDYKTFIVNYHTKNTEHFETFLDMANISITHFKADDTLFLSENLQVKYTENYIFLLDKVYEQLYRFNDSGQLINKIGRSGLGPSEYVNTGFFTVDDNNRTLSILHNNGTAIMIFDYDGNFLREFSTPFIITSFDQLDSNLYFYYTGYSNSPSFKRLHMADTLKILNSFLPLQTQAFDMIEMNFTAMGDYGYFREVYFPTIYKYSYSGIHEIFKINFGHCEITQKMLEEVKDPFEFFEKIQNNGFCSTASLIAAGSKYYVVTIEQKSGFNQVSHFYIDLEDSIYTRVYSNANNLIEYDFFSQLKPVYIDSENNLHFISSQIELKTFLNARPDMKLNSSMSDNNLNPLIVKIPINKN